jgi:hypothetical protein
VFRDGEQNRLIASTQRPRGELWTDFGEHFVELLGVRVIRPEQAERETKREKQSTHDNQDNPPGTAASDRYGARVIGTTGNPFTDDNVANAQATHDILSALRTTGERGRSSLSLEAAATALHSGLTVPSFRAAKTARNLKCAEWGQWESAA